MFGKGRECSLCGGRLNSQKICTECGLDNTKCDKQYKINQNVCDGEPLTHVHDEEASRKKSYTDEVPRTKSRMQKAPKKRNAAGIAMVVIIIIVIIGAVGAPLAGLVSSIVDGMSTSSSGIFEGFADLFDESDSYEFAYDPYEYVERELSETGEAYNTTLGQGEYLVGVHLPEGAYTISSVGDYVSVNVNDDENDIWLYVNLDLETQKAEDIRLYRGARIQVYGDATVSFSTQNAQLDEMASIPNPLNEEVLISQGRAEAGVDFEPGVYDVYAESNYGSLDVTIRDEQGEEWDTQYIWLDADSDIENIYRNLVLPQGAVISCEDDLRISLKPSESIASEDYMSYYLPN